MILTIPSTELFEGPWMLPEVRLVEKDFIMHVLAREQPLLDLIERGDRHIALAFKIPGEVVPVAIAECVRRHTIVEPPPRILSGQTTQEEANQRGEKSRDSASHGQP